MPPLPGLLLLLLPLLLSGPRSGGAQDPAASCDPDGCYAVYLQRRGFLDAWRSCRELGGNLATLKHQDEAAQVGQLLRDAAGAGAGPEQSPRLFWIGLQRQPRQCFPLRPLRGFMWVTGEQDTFYTNWARPAVEAGGGSSCAAPRCVVLDDRQGQWLEGSCTVPVDGYVCRFAFQGMCPGLDEEGGPVAYTTPFGPAGGGLRYAPFGTVAAVTCGGAAPAAVSVLCMQKDDGSVAWSKGAPLCREHGYPHSWCEGDNGGCQQLCLDEGAGYSCECHTGYSLLPDGHSCAPSDACRDQPCQFACVPDEEGGYDCRCPPGYELSSDEHHCEDVDECADAPCEHQCDNTDGSYLCRCHLGFSVAEDEPGHCADTDECQIPGVCQQMCVNYVGGFECYCTEGYDLEPDGISCSPVGPPPPLATARSPRGGGFFQHVEAGQVWPRGIDDLAEHGLALADRFPAFRDWDFEEAFPTDTLLDGTPPPEPSDAPVVSRSAPSGHQPGLPEPASPSNPSSPATSPPPALHSPLPARPDSPKYPAPTEPPPPSATPAPSTSPPVPPPGLGDAVVGGVRALLPALATPSPAPGGEEQPRRRRDDRWLLVALLVPMCVFVVIMLALGIVYCTRCGAQAKSRSITQCYRWVSSSAAAKGGTPSTPRPGQPAATCRTSV
ncbi:endosialin [Sphaerodactylus townsendi]|uniref:endosialin n=1 Tax=Sphaerodactylus townsendi TaxID=933632 RepID=UPI00202709BD|nr:endosialin [Sphaerodactylus townsendi]